MAIDRCACCDKELSSVMHFPLIEVKELKLMKPEEIPEILTQSAPSEYFIGQMPKRSLWRYLSDANYRAERNMQVIPEQVAEFFSVHPEAREHLFTDGFVYETPEIGRIPKNLLRGRQYSRDFDYFTRRQNLARSVKDIIQNSCAFKNVIASLEECVGKVINRKQLLSQEEPTYAGELNGEPVYLGWHDEHKIVIYNLVCNPENMGRLHPEVYYTLILEGVAKIVYEGRLNQPQPEKK